MSVKGYKVFNSDWKCRDYQFKVGKTFKHEGTIGLCEEGFHFCENAADCFSYYSFDPDNKIAEVEAIGNVENDGGDKSVTDELVIVREVTWEEMLTMVNQGKGNSGLRNTGDCNTGDWNTGDCNTGDWNTGDCNTGNRNTGDWNTGDWNTGDCNTGNRNTGDCNTGDWNTGDCNTGDWNLSDRNAGCFNTENHNPMFFDQESDISWNDWYWHDGRRVLESFRYSPTDWIWDDDMTDEEKTQHPEYKATQGYLKTNPLSYKEAFQQYWGKLSIENKAVVLTIPNFDANKFKLITGVDVHSDKE
jgi:hypothetical protein